MTATTNDGLLQTTTVGGETSIDFDFPIYTTADLEVIRTRGGVDTTLVLTTDYTIAASELNDPTGGVITLTSAAVAGDIYTCRSNIQEARSADFQQGGDFFSATVNSELDKIIRITQQLRRDLDRAVQISPTSTISPSSLPVTMDDPVAGSLLSFSSSGGIEPVTVASLGLSGLDTVLTSLAADEGLFWNGTHWVNSKVGTSNINSGAATSGQALTANGSGGASFTTISSDWVRLGTYNPSGASTVDITSKISSTYDNYVIVYNGLVPSIDGQGLRLQVSLDNGSTWRSTAGDYRYVRRQYYTDGTPGGSGSSETNGYIGLGAVQVGNATGECVSGRVDCLNLNSTSLRKDFIDHSSFTYSTTGAGAYGMAEGQFTVYASAVMALRLLFDAGNATGQVVFYGVRKS